MKATTRMKAIRLTVQGARPSARRGFWGRA
jgi:hypothetical protein